MAAIGFFTIDSGDALNNTQEISSTSLAAASGQPIYYRAGAGDDLINANNDGTAVADVANSILYLYGDDGDDIIIGGSKSDQLYGGNDNDLLKGQGGNDTLSGGNGNDTLFGGSGSDAMTGGAGNDELYGEAGNDYLMGQAGDDLLVGGFGKDTLSGGEGKDTFEYNFTGATTELGQGFDIITDFSSVDDTIRVIATAGTTLANFSYVGSDLSFNGTKFAEIAPASGFNIASDIIIV